MVLRLHLGSNEEKWPPSKVVTRTAVGAETERGNRYFPRNRVRLTAGGER